MGRVYAVVLASLAFCTCVARGLIGGGDVQATLQLACGSLILFGLIGLVAGRIATRVVEESVRSRLQAEINEANPET